MHASSLYATLCGMRAHVLFTALGDLVAINKAHMKVRRPRRGDAKNGARTPFRVRASCMTSNRREGNNVWAMMDMYHFVPSNEKQSGPRGGE